MTKSQQKEAVMLTALVSSFLGMAGGLLPDVFKEVRESREHKRELERMERNAKLQLRLLDRRTDAKLAELETGVAIEELRAFRSQMEAIYRQQSPSGIAWIDGFNALIRPATAALLNLLFVVTAAMFSTAVIAKYDFVDPADWKAATEAIWGSLAGEAIQAVLGYLFGYRSTCYLARRGRT
jgi:hypothetical protein